MLYICFCLCTYKWKTHEKYPWKLHISGYIRLRAQKSIALPYFRINKTFRNKWQILVYDNLTSAWPTAWQQLFDDHCVVTTVWQPLCHHQCFVTNVSSPLCLHCALCHNHWVTAVWWPLETRRQQKAHIWLSIQPKRFSYGLRVYEEIAKDLQRR